MESTNHCLSLCEQQMMLHRQYFEYPIRSWGRYRWQQTHPKQIDDLPSCVILHRDCMHIMFQPVAAKIHRVHLLSNAKPYPTTSVSNPTCDATTANQPRLIYYQKLVDEGVNFRITMSMTPPLLSMLDNKLLQERYIKYLETHIELCEKELKRTTYDERLNRLSKYYLDSW